MRALRSLGESAAPIARATIRLALCAPSLVVIAARTPVVAAAKGPDVSLSFELPKEVVLHEPVMADMDLDNASSQVVLFDADAAHMSFAVTSPDGSLRGAAPSPRGEDRRHLPCSDCFLPIGPAQVSARSHARHSEAVNAWLDFPEPGRYVVEVSYRGPVATASGVSLRVTRARKQVVTVLPRDPDVIRTHCREHAQEFRTHHSERAAKALSWTVDPAAVECLEDGADAGGIFAWEIVEPVAEIGGRESRNALERLSHSADATVAAVAKSRLAGVK